MDLTVLIAFKINLHGGERMDEWDGERAQRHSDRLTGSDLAGCSGK